MPTAVSTSITDMLRHTGANDLAARGLVHVLNVEAIRLAVSNRWPRHHTLVEDYVLRAFARNGNEDDFIVRVNDTDFVLIQPSRSPMSALSRSSQLLRETLTFFLGAAEGESINISVVDRIGSEGLEATRVSGDQLARAAAERTLDLSNSLDGSAPWQRFGVPRPPRKTVTIKRPNGPDLQTVFYLEPVWNVRRGVVISFIVRTVVVQSTPGGGAEPVDGAQLAPGASAALAVQRAIFVRDFLASAGDGGSGVAIHVPVSLNCLSYSGTRTTVLAELRRLAADDRRGRIFIELVHVPDAIPESRLSEAVAQLTPYARAVLVRIPSLKADVDGWSRSRVSGVIHDLGAAQMPLGEKAILGQLGGFVERVHAAGLLASLYGVRTHSLTIAAWSAGVTYLSGDYIAGHLGCEPVAQRSSIESLLEAPHGSDNKVAGTKPASRKVA